MRFNLIPKIILGVTLIILIGSVIIIFNLLSIVNKAFFLDRLVAEGNRSLKNSLFVLDNKLHELRMVAYSISKDDYVLAALSLGDMQKKLANRLSEELIDRDLDFVVVTDRAGKIYTEVNDSIQFDDLLVEYDFVRKALSGLPSWGIAISEKKGNNKNQTVYLKATEPLYDKMQYHILGTITLGIIINDNRSLISEIKNISGSEIIITLKDGNLIASSIENIPPQLLKSISSAGETDLPRTININQAKYFPLKFSLKKEGDTGPGKIFLFNLLSQKSFIRARDSLLMELLLGFINFAVTIIFLLILFIRRITHPIQKLRSDMAQLEKGNLGIRTQVKSRDEIGLLAESFNKMTEQLQKTTVSRNELIKEIEARKKTEEDLQQAYCQLRETQEQLMQAEKLSAVGQLATGVSHEVKNPLAIITQCAEFLRSEIGPDQKTQFEAIEAINNAVNRADKIIHDLLDFSRIPGLQFNPIDINNTIDSSIELAQHQLKFAKIQIVKEYDNNLPFAPGDENQIKQVFINIILNAAQAMSEGGQITIKTYSKVLTQVGEGIGRRTTDIFKIGTRVVVAEVVDTGTGIPQDKLKRVFEPFFTTKKTGQGVGLGMSITKSIIDSHRGLIGIESEVGKGTKITIILPVYEEEET